MLAGLLTGGQAIAQSPPPAGFSLSLTIGPGWQSNPLDVPGRTKGDGNIGLEAALRYRWNLWSGAGFTMGLTGFSEWFFRDAAGGTNRLVASATFSQSWQGFTLQIAAAARTSADQWLKAHDSAYQDISISVSRAVTIRPDLTLTPTIGVGRRFYQDGTEDQYRARLGLTLARKHGQWTYRLGGAYSWALEDNTPILPRINDRTYSGFTSVTYEWEKDREVALRLGYTRTLSSYQPNRTKNVTLSPQVSATFRF